MGEVKNWPLRWTSKNVILFNFIKFFFVVIQRVSKFFFKIFFSAVSTNFCIFSSGALKTQRDLLEMHKKKFFKNFFEVEKNSTKSDFSDFAPKKNFFSRRFSGNFASRGRDRDVFYRSVKKKSENSSIEARSSRAKKRGRFAWRKSGATFRIFFCIEIATEFSETWTVSVSGMVEEMCQFSAWSASIQGKNVQSVCNKICWCVALLALLRIEILYRLQRRRAAAFFGRAGKLLFSTS